MRIYEHYLLCENKISVHKTNHWPGTFTFLKIKTDMPVQHKEIFGDDSTQADSFEELRNKITEQRLDLW